MVELDGNSNQVIALHIACIIITSVAIALRFAARYRKRQSFAWDDGFMIVAWVTLMVYLGLVIKLTYMGSTMLTTAAIPPHDMINIFKLSYICGIIFETVNITVKVSILCFYTRIFTLEVIRREAYTVGAICAAWYTASVLVTAFQCVPVHKVWRRNAPGTCINLDGFILGYEVTNALLDIVLIVLPLRLIHSLNLDKRQKLLLSSIFLLGGFVCIASILRIVYLYHPSNPMHIFVNAPIWSAISIASAVLCANLPMLKPLLTRSILPLRLRSWIHTLTASTNKHSSDPSEPAGSKPKRGRNYNEISDEGLPPTIGGTRERRGAFKGGRDLYPLETFNETVVEGEKEGGGSGDGGECGGRA